MKRETNRAVDRVYVLDRSRRRFSRYVPSNSEIVSTVSGLRRSLRRATSRSFWISCSKSLTRALLRYASWPNPGVGNAMILHAVDPEMLPALLNCFCRCAVAMRFLPPGQLMEALSAPGRADLLVAGTLDFGGRTMTLWRGDMSPLTIPLSYFRPSGVGTRPDFARFSIEDYGRTVRLGEYEAAAEAILYEFDSGYRRRLKRERAATERSFGASLRRLRKQRELSREDFAPDICARTIARIERGKVQRVQAATLKAIAARLNVLPEEIETF